VRKCASEQSSKKPKKLEAKKGTRCSVVGKTLPASKRYTMEKGRHAIGAKTEIAIMQGKKKSLNVGVKKNYHAISPSQKDGPNSPSGGKVQLKIKKKS